MSRWNSFSAAARLTKLVDAGTFVTNGKVGHDRRIDVLSVIRQVLVRLAREGKSDAESG
jgi:hypothetical protein